MKVKGKLLRKFVSIVVVFYLMYISANAVAINKDKKISRLRQSDYLLSMLEQGKLIKDLLKIEKDSRVAVYGNGNFGKHLIRELIREDVNVSYIIDRGSNVNAFENIPILGLKDALPPTDIVLVTLVDEYENIKQLLSGMLVCSIINIEDVWKR